MKQAASRSEAKRLKAQKKVVSGKITALHYSEGFGFILGEDAQEYFFHRSMVDGVYEDLKVGDKVKFSPLLSAKGPRAAGVTFTAK